jgi:hypothetical protein
MQRRLIVWMIALGTVIAAQNSSHAAGAIAVGVPADVARDGAEFQVSFNFKTTAEAIERALSKCRAGTSSATKLCKIMATFNNHCGAEALDPPARYARLRVGAGRQRAGGQGFGNG